MTESFKKYATISITTVLTTFLFLMSLWIWVGVSEAALTDLGELRLNPNQEARMHTLISGNVRGFQRKGTSYKVNTVNPINASEKSTIINDLQALPATELPHESDKTEFASSPFANMTPAQADSWINTNVTDLDSAKIALRRIARVLIYLVRRTDLQ